MYIVYLFQQNIIKDFELNEVYNHCKKTLPKQKKKKDLETEKKENWFQQRVVNLICHGLSQPSSKFMFANFSIFFPFSLTSTYHLRFYAVC